MHPKCMVAMLTNANEPGVVGVPLARFVLDDCQFTRSVLTVRPRCLLVRCRDSTVLDQREIDRLTFGSDLHIERIARPSIIAKPLVVTIC